MSSAGTKSWNVSGLVPVDVSSVFSFVGALPTHGDKNVSVEIGVR
jgi:hypothetical protein